ncbi:copper homeostasis protein CutC [Cytophagaceae bacterium DM2B3-1]|uniref:PF03932 family protein CutC n=1 Tax=Xanthocytophaga flava TaxID=3048013 RepID=A0ABT7CIV8_9BACT|nr:copper homeostasis protein CutC [Xanthocytophaga flavus]MDJ1493658.1 copper homeostasis protein CutC [Xanthocytophaga flavus]
MSDQITVEICVNSAISAIEAQKGGANRVELCENLWEGGTTPSAGTIAIARKNLTIQLFVIIRPRGGDFLYSDDEFEVMKHDILTAKQLGADGIVTGILTADGRVDIPRMKELKELAAPLPITFHRAFDMVADPYQALEDCIALGMDRILTSGLEKSAIEGMELIAELVQKAAGRIRIMPGSGINEKNVHKLVQYTGVKEVHFSAMRTVDSQMEYRQANVFMGGVMRPPEFLITVTDPAKVERVRNAAQ